MADCARIDNGVVTQVIVFSNEVVGESYPTSDSVGQELIASLGLDGTWLQTSYNGNFRGIYAGIGYRYDPARDEFVVRPQE